MSVNTEIESGLVMNVISTVDFKKLPHWTEFSRSKIRGVTHYEIPWDKLEPGAELQMFEDNSHILFAFQGSPMGWMKPERADAVATLIRAGYKFRVSVLQVTGGTPGKWNRGCNIKIEAKNPYGAKPVYQDTNGNIMEAESWIQQQW